METGAAFRRHCLRVALLLLPAAYVAQLFATAVHEFLGHGVAAIMVGGRFTGLSLAWDGMGSAAAEDPGTGTIGPSVAILVAGVVATCSMGLLLLGAASWSRNGPARWVLLVFSASAFLEGAPYAFWNAIYLDGRGDIGRILRLLQGTQGGHADAWRAVFLVVGGLLTVLGTVLPLGRLLRDVTGSFPQAIDLPPNRRQFLATAFGVGGIAAWWLFDWDQLLPGVGVLPPVVGSALIVATAVWVGMRPVPEPRSADGVVVRTVLIAGWWLSAAACLAATLLWLGKGVSWA